MKLNDYEVQHYHFIIEGIQSCELIHSKLHYVMLFQCQIYPDKLVVSTFLSSNLFISSIKSSQDYLKSISVCLRGIIKLFLPEIQGIIWMNLLFFLKVVIKQVARMLKIRTRHKFNQSEQEFYTLSLKMREKLILQVVLGEFLICKIVIFYIQHTALQSLTIINDKILL